MRRATMSGATSGFSNSRWLAGRLAEHSRTAQLTIVSTRGHGRMVSALLGSVSRGLLERAEGPVMVVPAPDHFRHAPRRPR